jgi:hypothetical protein
MNNEQINECRTSKSFLHFESDEWGGMEFLQSPKIRLVCSDLSKFKAKSNRMV